MHRSPRVAVGFFLVFSASWLYAYAADAGNFWHGGTPSGMVATEVSALLGVAAYVEVLRSNVSRTSKALLGVVALPLAIFSAAALTYAVQYLVTV